MEEDDAELEGLLDWVVDDVDELLLVDVLVVEDDVVVVVDLEDDVDVELVDCDGAGR